MAMRVADEDSVKLAYNKCLGQFEDETTSFNQFSDGAKYCPKTFDGWSCWNDTPAGETVYIPCPSFIIGFDPHRLAHKDCLDDGTWFRHPLTNKTWSNYTTCIDLDDLKMRQWVIYLNIGGYSVSLIALLTSLFIFFSFRSMRCTRITIHKNLFISFVINNFMWIIWFIVLDKPNVLFSNPVGCQVLHMLLHYFMVCNYFWMFCEGFYLHTLLVVAFVNEDSIMKWLFFIGWVVPLPLTIGYAAARMSFAEESSHCWIHDSRFRWILTGPVLVSMLANFIFLINIVSVLVTKLRAVISSDTYQTRKAVRATIILIPLLGLHYLVTPFRPEPGSPGENVYEVVSAIVSSFQGLFVSTLFCFCNGEVISNLKKMYRQRSGGYAGRHSQARTSVSFPNDLKSEQGSSEYVPMQMIPAGKSSDISAKNYTPIMTQSKGQIGQSDSLKNNTWR